MGLFWNRYNHGSVLKQVQQWACFETLFCGCPPICFVRRKYTGANNRNSAPNNSLRKPHKVGKGLELILFFT